MPTVLEKLQAKVHARKQREERAARTARATAEFKHVLTSRSALEAVMPVPKNKLELKQQQRQISSIKGPHQQEMERILSLPVVT